MSSLPFEPALLQGHFFSIKIKSYKNFCISDDQLVSFDLLTFLDSHWEVLNDSVVQMVFLVTLHHPLFCTTHFLRLLTARRFGSYHCTAVNILCCKQIWDSWLITCFNITLWCKPEMLKKMKVEKSHLSLSGNKEHPCSRCGISQPASASQKTNKQTVKHYCTLYCFKVVSSEHEPTSSLGGRKDVQTRYTFPVLAWMLTFP